MDNVKALKNLASVILGVKVEDVAGESVADVINFIAENYKKSTKK